MKVVKAIKLFILNIIEYIFLFIEIMVGSVTERERWYGKLIAILLLPITTIYAIYYFAIGYTLEQRKKAKEGLNN